MVLAIMARKGCALSELTAEYIRYPQRIVNVPVSRKPDLMTVEPVRAIIERKEAELKGNGRIVVRYSGTESKVRVMVECESEEQCKQHTSEVAKVLEQELGTT